MDVSIPSSTVLIEADIADLITRAKGLDNIHDDVGVVDAQTDGLKTTYEPSTNQLYASDAEVTVPLVGYNKKKEFVVTCPPCVINAYAEIRRNSDNDVANMRFYVNGVAYSAAFEAGVAYPNWGNTNSDIVLETGDLVQLYAETSNARSAATVRYFRIRGDAITIPFVA